MLLYFFTISVLTPWKSNRFMKGVSKESNKNPLVLVAADHLQQFPACWTARIFRCHQCCEHQLFLLWSGVPSSGAAGSFLNFRRLNTFLQVKTLVWCGWCYWIFPLINPAAIFILVFWEKMPLANQRRIGIKIFFAECHTCKSISK